MSTKILAERITVVFGAGTTGDGMGDGQAAAISYARAGAKVIAVDFDKQALAKQFNLSKQRAARLNTIFVISVINAL